MNNSLIYRQDAIDSLRMDVDIIPFAKAREYVRAAIETIYNRLEELPPAQIKYDDEWRQKHYEASYSQGFVDGYKVCERPKGYMKIKVISAVDGEDLFCENCDAYCLSPSYNFCPKCGVEFIGVRGEQE